MTRTEAKRIVKTVKRDRTWKKTQNEAHETIALIKVLGIRVAKDEMGYGNGVKGIHAVDDDEEYDGLMMLAHAEYAQEKYDARYM
jgi:hypothetical protein